LWTNLVWLSLATLALWGTSPQARAADATADLPAKTALDDYIAKPDPSYAWKLVKTSKGQGFTAYLVDMTSQTWRTPQEVDRPVWKHWVIVTRPDEMKYDTGMLIISGGGNDGDPPDPAKGMAAQLAKMTRSVVVELKMIPNQPLVFGGDGKKRVEDDIIGYTWDKYLATGDPTWLARFPMVKAAVRAMDTVQTLLASEEGGKVKLDKFVVAGASKRGWTTWLTGAVDKRVVAIIPIVIDVLNCQKSLAHHYACYGFWAPAIDDYENHKICQRLDSPKLTELFTLVDPYMYRHRLTIPKYIVTGSGDQFFLPDSSRFYFDDLQGERFLRALPNTDHSFEKSKDSVPSIVAFYQMILDGKPRPEFTWEFLSDSEVHIHCKDKPMMAILWQATNPDARDFRLESLGAQYKPTVLTGSGEYVGKVETPAKGWTAWFVELSYPMGLVPFKVTTPVRVTPDTRPFADTVIPGTKTKAGQY
jgi:PhoPQ-activated pathogenicity-related protein